MILNGAKIGQGSIVAASAAEYVERAAAHRASLKEDA